MMGVKNFIVLVILLSIFGGTLLPQLAKVSARASANSNMAQPAVEEAAGSARPRASTR